MNTANSTATSSQVSELGDIIISGESSTMADGKISRGDDNNLGSIVVVC